MPIAGMSDLIRTWLASKGRNGRKGDATAMLVMLPRFALVVVNTYLSVFANYEPRLLFLVPLAFLWRRAFCRMLFSVRAAPLRSTAWEVRWVSIRDTG